MQLHPLTLSVSAPRAGILPHDGRNIKFTELNSAARAAYNFAPTLSYFAINYAANMLGRDYKTDAFDLADLDAHNCIEHDASLCREPPSPFFIRLFEMRPTRE